MQARLKAFLKLVSLPLTIGAIVLLGKYVGIRNPVYYLSNQFVIDGYQATKSLVEQDSNIIIVNIKDFPVEAIKDQIEIISLYNPAVIGVDYFPERRPENSEPINFQNVVLPIRIYSDSVIFAQNYFNETAHYGYVNINSYSTFTPYRKKDNKIYCSFPVKIIEVFDAKLFEKILKRNYKEEVINYAGNVHNFSYVGDLTNVSPALLKKLIKDKIVLMGYLGVEEPFPDDLNDIDVHRSPQSLMYGVVFWANIIHSLIGTNYIKQPPFFWSLVQAIVVTAFCLVIVQFGNVVCSRQPYKYILIKFFQLIQLVLLYIASSFSLHLFGTLLDYEVGACITLVIPEILFWSPKQDS